MQIRLARASMLVSENTLFVRKQPLQLRFGVGVFALFCQGCRQVGDARHGRRIGLAIGRHQNAEQLVVRSFRVNFKLNGGPAPGGGLKEPSSIAPSRASKLKPESTQLEVGWPHKLQANLGFVSSRSGDHWHT